MNATPARAPGRRLLWAGSGILFLGLGVAAWMIFGHRQPPGPPVVDRVIDEATRAEVIEQAAQALSRHYVFPDRGVAIAEKLRERARAGQFATIDSAIAFSETLTDTLQDISHDPHLAARYFDKPLAASADGDAGSADERTVELLQQIRFNFGFAHVMRLMSSCSVVSPSPG